MGIRAFDRIPVLLDIEIRCDNKMVTGTLMNISEKGMFIRTSKMPYPLYSQLEIYIPFKEEVMRVSGKLVREENIRGYYNGIGVEVLGPQRDYMDFIEDLIKVL